MARLETIHRLWDHGRWGDARLLGALRAGDPAAVGEARRELAHVVGAQETWLARLQRRAPHAAIWPEVDHPRLERLVEATHAALDAYLGKLREADLDEAVAYANSAGTEFVNTVEEILLHLFLHGQYHRGKANVALRTAGAAPAPVDFIAFARERDAASGAHRR